MIRCLGRIAGTVTMSRNGVDIAIEILSQLSKGATSGSLSNLAATIKAPRSSIYRVFRLLELEQMVSRSKDVISPGPAFNRELGISDWLPRNDGAIAVSDLIHPLGSSLSERHPHIISPLPVFSAPKRIVTHRRVRLGFINAELDNPWRFALVHSVEQAAAQFYDEITELRICHSGGDPHLQAGQILEFASQGFDGLIVSAIASAKVGAALREVAERNMPVILVDRDAGARVSRTSFVTASDALIGATTATWLVEMLQGKGRIVLLAGLPNALPSMRRLQAALETFKSWPQIKIAGTHWTHWRADVAREIVSGLLVEQRGPIDGVWCDSGIQCIGSLEAFAASTEKKGAIPPHTGGDLNGVYKAAIKHGVPLIGMDCPPAMGGVALSLLLSSLRGNWVPDRVELRSQIVVTNNASSNSVVGTLKAEDHVRWDLPDELILSSGLPHYYSPRSFRVHYPGNRYNRSAAKRSS